MPIHEIDQERLIATGVYHAMEVASRHLPSEMLIEGMPSEGRYEPAIDFVFKTAGHPSAMFHRRDVVEIVAWLTQWLEDNPTPEHAMMYTPEWQRTPKEFVR